MSILVEDEKLALSFKHVDSKSSWQGGEIMKKSHYKYLEIVSRAEFFFKKFSLHFEIYDKAIPDEVVLHPAIRVYFEDVIAKRKIPRTACKENPDRKIQMKGERERLLKKEILKLQVSSNPHEQYFYHLLKDFDRWNNWRILPYAFQEPHAFKRRQKNRYKKILMNTIKLEERVADYLEDSFAYKNKATQKSDALWAYICVDLYAQNFRIIPIKNKPEVIERFTNRYIYVFRNRQNAVLFVAAMRDYIQGHKRNANESRVKQGQRFWLYFREHTKLAVNWDALERITPDRKEFQHFRPLDKAEKTYFDKYKKILEEKVKDILYYDAKNNVYLLY